MKAVLMSIKPKWCEKIFSGEKTIEVRKVAPKLDLPFKVYVYRTKDKVGKAIINEVLNSVYGGGKVIGEFVCDKVEECIPDYSPFTKEFFYNDWEDCTATCMTSAEETVYGKGKPLYGWHITAPKRYDMPKELSEFVSCKHYNGNECALPNTIGCAYREPDLNPDGSVNIFGCKKRVSHPPRSWFYVEEIEE